MKGYAVLRIYVLSTGSCSFGREEDVANILSDTASSRPTWSRVAGYEAVSPEAICVLTRMRLRHCLSTEKGWIVGHMHRSFARSMLEPAVLWIAMMCLRREHFLSFCPHDVNRAGNSSQL